LAAALLAAALVVAAVVGRRGEVAPLVDVALAALAVVALVPAAASRPAPEVGGELKKNPEHKMQIFSRARAQARACEKDVLSETRHHAIAGRLA
jgi:hypothetical protein